MYACKFVPLPADDAATTQTEDSASQKKRFTGGKKPLTLEAVKGVLLSTTDSLLATVSEIIVESNMYDKGKYRYVYYIGCISKHGNNLGVGEFSSAGKNTSSFDYD